ncbi:MAG: HD domain-containing protein [Lachnospiraceae bacterium]|nr:HD domain-containing protein [Lachnospiraceae bacterium]
MERKGLTVEEKRNAYFTENERKVNKVLIRLGIFAVLIGPLAAIATASVDYKALSYLDDIVISVGAVLVFGLAFFLYRVNPENPIIKYVILIGLHVGVCYAGTKYEINMYMLYALVPALSCLYFSRWYTIRLGEVCYCMMLISLGLRATIEADNANKLNDGLNLTSFEWFGMYGFRMTIEYIVMFIVFFLLVRKIEDTIDSTLAKNKQMRRMQKQLIAGFANFMESKDENTGFHIRRTADYAKMIADELVRSGYHKDELTPKAIDNLVIAAPLHDAGKVYIPDSILQKTGELTPEEYEIIKSHTTEGGRLIEMNLSNLTDRELYTAIKDVALCHHEWWNGAGYPHGYKGESIPLLARIVAAADTLDALLSQRSYKPSMDIDQVMQVFREEKGTHFEPCIAIAVLNLQSEIKRYVERESIKMSSMTGGETEELS